MEIKDYFLLFVALIFISILFWRPIRENTLWRATVTPLASIIGSGFLIAAPVLGESMGTWTPFAMAGIIILSYLIGWVIRFNIKEAEPLLNAAHPPHLLKSMEFASNLAVFAAYLISVAFYLRVMSAFILRSVDMNTELNANILTSLVLMLICVAGLLRGLKTLELLEEYSVSIKLSIIGAACAGLMWFSFENGEALPTVAAVEFDLDSLRILGGMLLMVQGFETSRYLGDEYDSAIRIRSMKYAQIFAGVLYIGFVILFMPLLGLVQDVPPEETAIIGMMEHVSLILPFMMIVAATFSQFSAAVADTLSGGGIVREESQGLAPARAGYAIITIGAIILIWQINIFEIVAYASRAFAFYYFTQCLVAIITALRSKNKNGNSLRITGFTTLALILLWITIYAVPVE